MTNYCRVRMCWPQYHALQVTLQAAPRSSSPCLCAERLGEHPIQLGNPSSVSLCLQLPKWRRSSYVKGFNTMLMQNALSRARWWSPPDKKHKTHQTDLFYHLCQGLQAPRKRQWKLNESLLQDPLTLTGMTKELHIYFQTICECPNTFISYSKSLLFSCALKLI